MTTIPSPSFTTFIEKPKISYRGVNAFVNGSNENREVLMRLLQYTLRFLIFLRRQKTNRRRFEPLLISLLSIVSLFSALRRLLNLYEAGSSLVRITESLNPLRYYYTPTSTFDKKGKSSVTSVLRQTLDFVSTVSDAIFLFTNLSLLPLSKKSAQKVDQISDLTALLCSILGLYQVSNSRTEIYKEGRELNRTILLLEDKFERREFWEEGDKEKEKVDGYEVEGGEKEEGTERRKLKEKIKRERIHLKNLRSEVNVLYWERLRLIAEAIFAGYDFSRAELGSEGAKAVTGLASSLILFSQTWSDYLKSG